MYSTKRVSAQDKIGIRSFGIFVLLRIMNNGIISSVVFSAFIRLSSSSSEVTDITIDAVLIETSARNFDVKQTRFSTVKYEQSVGLSSNDSRWGGLSSILFSQSGESWLGVTQQGQLILSRVNIIESESMTVTLVQLLDSETNEHVTVESVSTISGSSLVDPFFDGVYVRVSSDSTPVRLYQPIEPDTYDGVVFNKQYEDALALCPETFRVEITGCSSAFQTLTSISTESGQSTGSLLFLCETRSNDDLFHGSACNPSTGDTWTFSFEASDGWKFADWSFCPSCVPEQIFLLSYNETAFAVDTILVSALRDAGNTIMLADDLVHGRVRLFESSAVSHVRSMSVIQDPYFPDMLKLHLGAVEDKAGGITAIHVLSVKLSPEGASVLRDVNSSSFSLSIMILVLLITAGIAIPLTINRYPKVKRMFESPGPSYVTLESHRISDDKKIDPPAEEGRSRPPIGRRPISQGRPNDLIIE
jgi:hypothetical protein